ncbi:Aspartate aminotransferase [Lactiplantibacillus plantarum]|nr:Aspartate aminotransferase [Lactiplantibacillus plantarum]QIL58866.1 ABC transporter ATP-binding protein [Lactiplantibacillus plantarum]
MVNTILKEADLFCPNSVRINFTIYHKSKKWSETGPNQFLFTADQ